MKTTTKDLTKGTIWKQLIAFAIPLIWGNLFQLTYNMVDSIVVGQFAGQDALAAVGTSDPVMNLLILGVTGLCIGASVIMSNCFGAGKTEELKHEVGMTLLLVMGMSAVILVGGLIASEGILKLMQTPTDILPLAESYLHIIFIGMPFTCLYNIYAASLRSVGDAKTPVYFLVLSSVLNGALDVLFVALCNLCLFSRTNASSKERAFSVRQAIDMDDSTVRWYVVTSAVQSAAWKAFDSGCNQYAWCWCNGSI